MLILRRNRADYLRNLLTIREAEKHSLRIKMKSVETTQMSKKELFTRYTSVIMDMRKLIRELHHFNMMR